MSNYYGDFAEDETLYIPFNTFDSNDPSASVTITNLADADIKVHKDGSATQIVTDGATIAIDFDSITGNHLITIDTSAHADYSTGSDYLVRIEGTTVDAATINAWVGSFSIQNRYSAGALRPTTAGRSLDVTATGAAGIDWANVEGQGTAVDLSGTDIQLVDTVTTYTGNTPQTADHTAGIADIPTVAEFNARTLAAASYFDPAADTVANVTTVATTTTNTDMRGTDSALLASSAPTNFGDMSISVTTGLIDITQTAADKVWSTASRILTASTNFNDVAATDIVSSGAITTSAGAVSTVTTVGTTTTNTDMRGTDSAATEAKQDIIDTNVDAILVDTGTTIPALIGTPAADISADIAAVKVDTAAILVDTGTTLPALIDDLAVKKNTAFSNFEFLMVLTSDHVTPATGLTVTGQRSIDGAAFASVGGSIAEVSNGIYQFDALQADTNGDVITWRFSSATADDTFVTFKTVA